MTVRTRRLCVLFLFALALLHAPAVADQFVLLNAVPPGSDARRLVDACGGTVVRESRQGLLVRAPAAAVARLEAAGLPCVVVASPADSDSCYLVRSSLPTPLLAQPGDILCRPLEEGVWLLWTGNRDFRDWLIQPYRIKALPSPAQVLRGPAAAPARGGPRSLSVIQDLVAQVSLERLRNDILSLQNFRTRYASTAACEAAGDFILQRFSQLGLSTTADPFTFESRYASRNIVAVLPGQADPGHVILACAHYDSTSNAPQTSAPGADDNGSGTAAVLELARILASEKFNLTIVLLCVSAEEWGLYGSAHYAQEARQRGDDIVAVVNLDMIAYPGSRQRVLDVIGNSQSSWLADRFIAVAQPFVAARLAKVIDPSLDWSDHSSFWDQGYAALCGIEESDNPYYHRTSDTLDTLDLTFATEAAQAALAAVVELAQPASSLPPPAGLRAQSQVSASTFGSVKTVYLSWQASSGAAAGYHVFRAQTPGGPYLRLTTQPLAALTFKDSLLAPGQSYFYVLTAVDAQGRESGYSREVRDDENN